MLEKRKGIPSLKGYYTTQSGEKFHYDSMTELAVMMYLDGSGWNWRKNTKLRIPYLFEGKERKYIPDFIIEPNKICPGYIMEIKGSNDKPELPYKCEAAKIYCLQHGMKFMLVPYDKVKKLVNWDKVKEYHYQHNKK